MIASEVIDLPQPDSPTRPRTSPGAIENDTSVTISTGCDDAPIETVRPLTENTALALAAEDAAETRIQPIAQGIADKVQGEGREHNH